MRLRSVSFLSILIVLVSLSALLSDSAFCKDKVEFFDVKIESNPFNPNAVNNPLGKYKFGHQPETIHRGKEIIKTSIRNRPIEIRSPASVYYYDPYWHQND